MARGSIVTWNKVEATLGVLPSITHLEHRAEHHCAKECAADDNEQDE